MSISLFCPETNRDDAKAASDVVKLGWVGPGKKVEQFEQELAQYVGRKYCVATSSGTAAIMAALLAHRSAHGKEVLVAPACGHPAAINAALALGYKIELCDVHSRTGCMSQGDLAYIMGTSVGEQGGILAFIEHNGRTSDTQDAYEVIPEKYRDRWMFLQDSCQSMHADGKPVGDVTVVSFSPQKIITTGQGGAVLTDKESMKEYLQRVVSQGIARGTGLPHRPQGFGVNLRMSDVSAAIGLSQLSRIEKKKAVWRRIRSYYDERRDWVWCPCVQTENAVELLTALAAELVWAARLYVPATCNPLVLSRAKVFGDLSGSRNMSHDTVYLPGHHKVSHAQVLQIRKVVERYGGR